MPEFLKVILEALKLAPRYLAGIGLIAAILLFGGDNFSKKIGVYDFTQHYRPWIGFIFLGSLVLFGIDRSIAFFQWKLNRKSLRKCRESRLKRLNSLTEEEKQILRFYIGNETKTNYLRIGDGVTEGLVAAGIIFQSCSVGHILDGFAYNITDFAWEHLKGNQWLLNGRTNTWRTDKRPSCRYDMG